MANKKMTLLRRKKGHFLFLAPYFLACLFVAYGQAGQISKKQGQELKPFDTSQEKLPADYHGFAASDIKRALSEHKRLLKKDEDETTEQYLTRKKQVESRPLIGSVFTDSKLLLSLKLNSWFMMLTNKS